MSNLAALLKTKGKSLSDLARETGVNKATVTRWAQKTVPLTRVYQVEEKTGISRHDLRPDFFGDAAPEPDRPAPADHEIAS